MPGSNAPGFLIEATLAQVVESENTLISITLQALFKGFDDILWLTKRVPQHTDWAEISHPMSADIIQQVGQLAQIGNLAVPRLRFRGLLVFQRPRQIMGDKHTPAARSNRRHHVGFH